jgi:light-regulated signal transduction histidine kinase (bacteriophytochrome)
MSDASAALARALDNLSAAIKETAAEVSHDPLPHLKMSEIQLLQVFQNLIGNAIKYRKNNEEPRIHVGVSRNGKEWLISVRDNGIGIAAEYKELVFGIFKRLHTDAKYSGTGIGLAICQKVVERNGGRIWLESEGLEKGSTFYFSVPA